MTNPDFEIVPFVFQPARDESGAQTWQAWEGERRGGAASPPPARASRATRASPARPQRKLPPPRPSPRPQPRPPALRRPLDAARFVGWPDTREPAAPREPCICPAHGTEYVRWVQSALNRIEGLALPVDGVMSAATRSALRGFQGRNNLPADGIAGPDTEQALRDAGRPADASAAPSEPGQDAGEVYDFETLALESPVSRPTLRQGSSGSAVTDLQRQLAAAGFSPGPADGIFGAQTGAAVKSFQRSRGITADGIVGSQTWGKLGIVPGKPSATPSGGAWGGSGSVRYGKGWGGSEGVADAAKAIAASMNARVTSQKRDLADTIRVGSNTGSDHYTGNTTAFAVDFAASGSRGDELAAAIAAKYGIPQNVITTYTRTAIQVSDRRYSLQLLWRVEGHYDHVHLGIRSV